VYPPFFFIFLNRAHRFLLCRCRYDTDFAGAAIAQSSFERGEISGTFSRFWHFRAAQIMVRA